MSDPTLYAPDLRQVPVELQAPRILLRCPLCGGPNGCAPAQTGSFREACWCTEVAFPAELPRKLPQGEAGRACVCRKCAQSAA